MFYLLILLFFYLFPVNLNKKNEQENKIYEKPSKKSSKKTHLVLEHTTNIKEEMGNEKLRVDLNKSDSSTSRTQTSSDPQQSFSASRSQSPMYLRAKKESEETSAFEQVDREALSSSSKLSIGVENNREKCFDNEELHENDSFMEDEEEEEEEVEHDEDELIEEEVEEEEEGELNTTSTSDNYFIKSPVDDGKAKAIGIKEDNLNNVIYDFTLQALEASLYGYLRQKDNIYHGHAISGFMLPSILPDKSQMPVNSKSTPFQMDEDYSNKGEFIFNFNQTKGVYFIKSEKKNNKPKRLFIIFNQSDKANPNYISSHSTSVLNRIRS